MKQLIEKEIGPIPNDGRTFFLADGTWSLFELIDYCLDYIGPSEVFLTSFSLSEDSIRHLLHLKETGKILSLSGLFDPSLRKTKTPLLYFAAEVFDRLRLTANHSKIILFSSRNRKLTVVASANLGRNRRIETGIIETDEKTYWFYKNKLDAIFDLSVDI